MQILKILLLSLLFVELMILITGGSGYIGTHTLMELHNSWNWQKNNPNGYKDNV